MAAPIPQARAIAFVGVDIRQRPPQRWLDWRIAASATSVLCIAMGCTYVVYRGLKEICFAAIDACTTEQLDLLGLYRRLMNILPILAASAFVLTAQLAQ